MRKRYLWRDGRWVDRAEVQNRTGSAPAVISDSMDALRHPATGQTTDSKSAFRRMTKDAGCVEIGTSEMPEHRPTAPNLQREVGEAMQMLNQGYRPQPMAYADFDD